MTLKILKQLKE